MEVVIEGRWSQWAAQTGQPGRGDSDVRPGPGPGERVGGTLGVGPTNRRYDNPARQDRQAATGVRFLTPYKQQRDPDLARAVR